MHSMQHAAFIDLRQVWTTACSFRTKRDPHPPTLHTPGQRCASYLKPYEIRWASDKPRDHVKAFNDMARALTASAGDLNLSGIWRKDQAASDSMDDACDAVQLPWVLRQALKVLTTLEIDDTKEHFKTVIKAGGIMDVVECYPWTGEQCTHSRRDKRWGLHKGGVVRTAEGPSIRVEWDNPFGGECSDTFVLSEDGGSMTQLTDMTIRDSGRRCVYKCAGRVHDVVDTPTVVVYNRTVYRRQR